MATLSTVISYGEPTGTIVTEIGTPGPSGQPGPKGDTGAGVPAGGTSGQFLTKTTTGVDYATGWTTLSLAGYATESWVTAGFYPLTGNPSAFLQAAALSPYLTTATANATFQTLAGMSSYLTTSAAAAGYYPLTGNPSGFLTAASLSGYATQSWVTSQGYATQSYVNGQGFITASALTPYLLSSTAASTYQTISGMSAYLSKAGNLSGLSNTATARTNLGLGTMATQTASDYLTVSAAAAGYYPLTGNPSGFITSSALTGYATESFVTSQGYIGDAPSDGSQYARQDGAWSVVTGGGGTYLPLEGGTMDAGASVLFPTTGYYTSVAPTILKVFESTNELGVTIAHDSITIQHIDTPNVTGYVTNEYIGFEDLGGSPHSAFVEHDVITVQDETSSAHLRSAGFDAQAAAGAGSVGSSLDYAGLSIYDGTTSASVTPTQISVTDTAGGSLHVNSTGIQFPDSSVQSSAAFVPGSGNLDMTGYDITNANFSSSAGQVSAQNVTLSSGGSITFGDSTVQTTAYTGGGGGGVPEAPQDNKIYGRINGIWIPIPGMPNYSTVATYIGSIAGWYYAGTNLFIDSNGGVLADTPNVVSYLSISGGDSPNTTFNLSLFTSLTTASITGNAAMTSAPSFYGLTALTSASITGNTSMTSAPSFDGCSALNHVEMNNNTSMTSAPSFDGLTALTSASITGNTSMTSTPTLIACYALTYFDASNCAIANCNDVLYQINNIRSNPGYCNISGGTNQAVDPANSYLTELQDNGWTVVFNSL